MEMALTNKHHGCYNTNIDYSEEEKTMKYLNDHKAELFDGHKVTYLGKVYWANMTTMEIYAHSVDEEILGSINGYKVADITRDWKIVESK